MKSLRLSARAESDLDNIWNYTVAEFEREMIRERTKAGLDAARAEGRIGGRRPVLRDDQKKDIIENILSDRKTGAQMARLYNVSEATISRIVAKHRQPIS